MTHLDELDHRIALKLFVTVYLVSAFFFKPQLDFSRFEFLTKALVHHRTIAIDDVMRETGVDIKDKVAVGGRTFIAVTPGLSFLALITYWPYSWFVAPRLGALPPDLDMKLTQYAMAIGTVIPAAALAVVGLFLMLRQMDVDRPRALLFSALFYAGTPVLFYSLNLTNGQNIVEMSIQMIALSLLVMARGAFAAGILQGLAVFINMPAAIALPFVALYLWLERRAALPWWIAGLLPGLLSLQVYNSLAFGGELSVYHIIYRGWVPLASLAGAWLTALDMLAGWRVGVLFFCPVVLLLLFVPWRTLRPTIGRRLIVAAGVVYVLAWCVMQQIFKVQQTGSFWLQAMGGGGPRYLLPVIPLLVLGAALADLRTSRRHTLAAVLILMSFIVNVPGLFWTGGTPWVLNNLVLFLKNGFHSYTIDLVRDLLVLKGLNVSFFGMWPAASVLTVCLWWIWRGNEGCQSLMTSGNGRR